MKSPLWNVAGTGAFLLACTAGTAHAQQAQLCFTDTIPQTTTGWNDDLTFSLFDPDLGVLKSVEFNLTAIVEGSASFESLDSLPTTVTTNFSANVTVFRPGGGSAILTNAPTQSFIEMVSAADGMIDFMGTAGRSFPNISISNISTTFSPPPPSDLTLFTGMAGMPGSITLPVSAIGTSSGSGAGNLIQQFMQTAGADLEVCYNYDFDCDGDGIGDPDEIMMGSLDCNMNGVPDECEVLGGDDCNMNGVPDDCDISTMMSMDCDMNGVPDECDVDCNMNMVPDACDISGMTSTDLNSNGIPDECELDCNGNLVPDSLDIANMTSDDCNSNGIPDECEQASGFDCNFNGIPDDCDAGSTSMDTNMNGIPDECETSSPKCNGDGGDQMGCIDCPCNNNAAPGTIGGCLNSTSGSARLVMTGFPSVSNDTVTMRVTGAPASSFAVLFSSSDALPLNPMHPCFGTSSGLSTTMMDGLRCLGGTVRRHPTRQADAAGNFGIITAPWGPPAGPPQGLIARGQWSAGATTCWQVYYRDDAMQVCNTGVNTTNALLVTITP